MRRRQRWRRFGLPKLTIAPAKGCHPIRGEGFAQAYWLRDHAPVHGHAQHRLTVPHYFPLQLERASLAPRRLSSRAPASWLSISLNLCGESLKADHDRARQFTEPQRQAPNGEGILHRYCCAIHDRKATCTPRRALVARPPRLLSLWAGRSWRAPAKLEVTGLELQCC